MIAVDSLPLSFVEGRGLKRLMAFLELGYAIPSRKSIGRRLCKIYDTQKDDLREALAEVQHVALTTDCWTSRAQEGFMTVTAHFLDDKWSSQS